jgi:serine/threonine protein kinase
LLQRNILIDDHGKAQLCDFGLVRVLLEEGNSGMTTTTAHTGTLRYLAYELLTAGEPVPTMASDIYATGCIGLEASPDLEGHAIGS